MKYLRALSFLSFTFLDLSGSQISQKQDQKKTLKQTHSAVHIMPALDKANESAKDQKSEAEHFKPRALLRRSKFKAIDGAVIGATKEKLEICAVVPNAEFSDHLDKTSEELKLLFNKKIAVHHRKELLGKMRIVKQKTLWHDFKTQIQRERKMRTANKKLFAQKRIAGGLVRCNERLTPEPIKNDSSFTSAIGGSLVSPDKLIALTNDSDTVDVVD